MGRKKKIEVEVPKVEEVQEEVIVQNGDNITYHLDRDPNDPRNVPSAGPLPSLDD